MFHYIKFFHYFLIVLIGCACLLLADYFILIGFGLFIGAYVLGDAFLGDDLSEPDLTKKHLLNSMLYASFPLSIFVLSICAWLITPQTWGFMLILSEVLQYDFVAAKQATTVFELAVGIIFAGFMLSGVATVVGHELVHRVGKKFDVSLGRWLMSLSFDANFSIEHVYHHHAKVATEDDPVTAPRGRNVYVHVVYALWGTNKSAWLIEKKRLSRKKQNVFSVNNLFIRGWLMTLVVLSSTLLLAGWQAMLYVAAVGIMAKLILEVVNYMEHYGLVRHPRQPVKPKHSWNSNRKISNWAMFNLPRHSHHHAQGAVPFEKLKSMPEAPEMISGYISTFGVTLIPPLWFRLMAPKLEEWDTIHANEQELEIIKQQSQRRAKNALVAIFH
jgi:alkane 1-monooxygenase